jgi:glutathione S-transferase
MTRATRPRWLLEELGVPYELVRVDLSAGEQTQPEYRKVHPHGRVPALVDGEMTMFESAAICLYLADRFPEKRLAPPPDSPLRGPYYQWMVYSVATAEPPLLKIFLNTVRRPEGERNPKEVEEGRAEFREVADVLSRALEGKPFLLGSEFSAADVMIGSVVGWARSLRLLEDRPVLKEYSRRLVERPAYKRATED